MALRRGNETCGKMWNVVLPDKLPETVSGEAAAELLLVRNRERKDVETCTGKAQPKVAIVCCWIPAFLLELIK